MDTLQKDVVPPPAPSSSPLHRHTGFVIAIVITSVLLIIAAVLAYLSWDNGLKLARENISLLNAAGELQAQNNDLQEQLATKADPISFYYTETASPFVGPTNLHAVHPITGEDTIVFTVNGYYEVIAQPRRGWTGQILLNKITEGDNPSYVPYLFDVASGTELMPAPVAPVLPIGRTSVSLSPDERYFAAVYDSPEPTAARSFAFLDVITGEKYDVETLLGLQYASSYSDFANLGKFDMRWVDHDCIAVHVWGPSAHEGEVTLVDVPQYCISDFVQ